jgi:hypothetical protein
MEMTHVLVTDQGSYRLDEAPREELEKALIEAYRMLEEQRERHDNFVCRTFSRLSGRVIGPRNRAPVRPSAFPGLAG